MGGGPPGLADLTEDRVGALVQIAKPLREFPVPAGLVMRKPAADGGEARGQGADEPAVEL